MPFREWGGGPKSMWFDGVVKFRRSETPGEEPTPGDVRPGEIVTNPNDEAIWVGGLLPTPQRLAVAEGFDRIRVLTQGEYDTLVAEGKVVPTALYIVTGS